MRLRDCRAFLLGLCLASFAATSASAQADTGAGREAKRQQALALFSQGKRLEARPLLEELAQTDPQDDAVLVALAASLVDHAATLTDEAAAGEERLRARKLLEQAWDLGNNSPLAMNLRELLRQLPASGSVKFSDDPQVQHWMQAGEAAFSRRDFGAARENYAKALEAEPGNSSAALFIGNTYDKENQFAKAEQWYQRAIELDPNVETPFRYYADMLAREGDMAGARGMLIQAVVAEPYNRIVWRELRAWATLNNTRVATVYVGIPAAAKDGGGADGTLDGRQPPQADAAWAAYQLVRTKWQRGGEFKKHYPEEKQYRHTLAEESEALTAAAKVLEKLREEKPAGENLDNDAATTLLLSLYDAGLIEPYALFSLGDAGIARDYATYRAKNRRKLEQYLGEFVVPPLH